MMGDSECIRNALAFIPAHDRDTWVKMGMAIKSELGEDGFDTWDEWSQQEETYSASDARAVWKSIGATGGVNVGTLFYEAKANGWHEGGTSSTGTANEEPGMRLQKVPKRMATEGSTIVRERTTAAQKATAIWEAAKAAPDDHAYLLSKGIKAHSIRVYKGALVIPVSDGRELYSLQFINGDGRKRFLADGRVSGCCYLIGNPHDATTLCIAEGFATGASIHEATGHPVAVAFNAGNLLTVARALRSRFTAASIIICADDDVQANGNPGITKATEAAHAIGALLAVPNFGNDRPDGATDLNDMARQCGNEAVKRVVANAKAPAMSERRPATESAHGEYPAPTVDLIRGSDIKPESVTWLWPGWLAAGKVHILGGAPGTGKTTISMAIAAIVTTGACWPDGARSPIGNVVIWSGEDDPTDTLVPRLILSGANLDRVYFIADVTDCHERRSFDPAKDMEPLWRKLAEIGDIRLLIVDPIVSAVAGDSHKNAEVRRALQPLADLAASMQCTLFGITHFAKGTSGRDPVERITGSLAFGALARVVLVAAKHQEKGADGRTARLLLRAKSNIGPDEGGFEYDLQTSELESYPEISNSHVIWGNSVEGAARDLLATADAIDENEAGENAMTVSSWLTDLLTEEGGRIDRRDVMKAANAMGYKERSVHRAREKLGLAVRQSGFGKDKRSTWTWGDNIVSATIVPCVPNKIPGMNGTYGGKNDGNSEIEVEV